MICTSPIIGVIGLNVAASILIPSFPFMLFELSSSPFTISLGCDKTANLPHPVGILITLVWDVPLEIRISAHAEDLDFSALFSLSTQ